MQILEQYYANQRHFLNDEIYNYIHQYITKVHAIKTVMFTKIFFSDISHMTVATNIYMRM